MSIEGKERKREGGTPRRKGTDSGALTERKRVEHRKKNRGGENREMRAKKKRDG